MARYRESSYVTDEERRDFLKALGVAGAIGVSGTGLQEVRNAMTGSAAGELEAVGEAIKTDLAGTMDAALIADQQAALAEAVGGLSGAVEQGISATEPHNEFSAIAAAGLPIYDHLGQSGFFESTTQHLPTFEPEYLTSSIEAFVGSEVLSKPLADLGLTGGSGVDLLTEVVANAEELSTYHWVATDEIPREEIAFGEYIPSMTKAATSGVLLWLGDLDEHLWQKQLLLTEDIHEDAIWHARSMTAGFQLMSEGAKDIAEGSGRFSNKELSALLSTGFAVQAIAQNLLPEDTYWITEEMRAPRT